MTVWNAGLLMFSWGIRVFNLLLLCLAVTRMEVNCPGQAVRINELVAIASDHGFDRSFSSVSTRLGTGSSWFETNYDDHQWAVGSGPFGFRQSIPLGTNLEVTMKLLTPSLYLRAAFVVTQDQIEQTSRLLLSVGYDDAFVAYLNGREIARRNLAHEGWYVFADHPSFHKRLVGGTEVLEWPNPWTWLRPGTNVLAIQAHNAWPPQDGNLNRSSFLLDANLYLGLLTHEPIVASTNAWRYFVGRTEPSGSVIDYETLAIDPAAAAFSDWIELKNESVSDINLGGWSLSDDEEAPRKWVFPQVVLPSQGYLVVFCSGLDRAVAGQSLHANFKLDENGERIGLYDHTGQPVHELSGKYPPQSPFYSYGRDSASGTYGYFREPSPGAANGGSFFEAICEKPRFDLPAGFYDEPIQVSVESLTAGGEIRYTTDGTEPALDHGFIYDGPITLVTNTALRARVYRPGWVPSRTRTSTYLIGQPGSLRSIPSVAVTGDSRAAIYKPDGVTAISGGQFGADAVWSPLSESNYNMALMYGRAFERPVSFEWLAWQDGDYRQADCGLRLAASPFSRPRMTMINLENTIWKGNWYNKPSFSFFFRNDYGPSELDLNLIPGAAVHRFDSLRLRAGKNDWANPFVRDELVRRMFVDMGQLTSRGQLCGLFINGHYKGYFNLVERLRQPFYQSWTGSTNDWDVRLVDAIEEGDGVRWDQDMSFVRTASLDSLENYEEAARRFDLVNFADYILLNAYCAMADWPYNNWYAARERTDNALWRFQVWDAEGSFGAGSSKKSDYDTFLLDLSQSKPYPTPISYSVAILFSAMSESPEFRLLFADRIQRHLHGEGVLAADNVLSNYLHLSEELNPSVNYVFNQNVATAYMIDWVVDRPPQLLQHCRTAGLWPDTQAPQAFPPGTLLSPNEALVLSHTNPRGEIYYSIDGTDPRAPGGAVAGQLYQGPMLATEPIHLKARVLRQGEWSPLLEVRYRFPVPPSLVISEINYDPIASEDYDGFNFEFVELHNAGPDPVDLTGLHFSTGITCQLTNGPILEPDGYAIIVSHLAAFQSRYPGVAVAGIFSGRLANEGERLTLEHQDGETLFSVDYNDLYPWPSLAAGRGFTLVRSGEAGLGPDDPIYWRSSTWPGGSPGLADPIPADKGVVIHELLSRADTGESAFIEFSNSLGVSVDVSGWYVSLNANDPFQYRIPSGAVIPGGGYYALNAESLVPLPGYDSFSFDPAGGMVGVFSADLPGSLSGYAHVAAYESVFTGVSQGIHRDSQGQSHFVPLSEATPGEQNSLPRLGAVVLSEIHYDPRGDTCRFIELHNPTTEPVALFQTNRLGYPWRLDGVDFVFQGDIVLDPGEFLLVTECDPQVLRVQRDVPAGVRVFGPWPGRLDQGGEWLRLQEIEIIPSSPGNSLVYMSVDAVRYNDKSPWPEEAAGEGWSLQRIDPPGFGNDPAQWFAGPPTAGRRNSSAGVPSPVITLRQPQSGAVFAPGDPLTLQVDIENAPDVVDGVDYVFDGESMVQVSSDPWGAVVPAPEGLFLIRAKVRFASGWIVYSESASIQVITQQWLDTELVPFNAVWKYDDRGLDLGNAWVLPTYDDRDWNSGPAQLGYGEGDEATVVGYGMPSPLRNVTTYFRHAFSLPAGLTWDGLALDLVRDDGAVVYLNGVEAARSNMGDGVINYLTQTPTDSKEENAPVRLSLNPFLLKPGLNQLAVEVHQVHRSSPDMSFALRLAAQTRNAAPWILRHPQSATIAAGEGIQFEVEATGADLAYQWYDGLGQPVAGATSSKLELPSVLPGDQTAYHVMVSNRVGAVRSQTAHLHVVVPDTDRDEMADYWEEGHGLNPLEPLDAFLDPDGDEQSNADEFKRGTDPYVFTPYLTIAKLAGMNSGGEVQLRFLVPANEVMLLEWGPHLMPPDWSTLSSFGPWATNRYETWTSPVDMNRGFYRLSYGHEDP